MELTVNLNQDSFFRPTIAGIVFAVTSPRESRPSSKNLLHSPLSNNAYICITTVLAPVIGRPLLRVHGAFRVSRSILVHYLRYHSWPSVRLFHSFICLRKQIKYVLLNTILVLYFPSDTLPLSHRVAIYSMLPSTAKLGTSVATPLGIDARDWSEIFRALYDKIEVTDVLRIHKMLIYVIMIIECFNL